jgi:hypothetical protein
MEDKLQAYPPEYIYNVQRLVSSGWSGFRYRFTAFPSRVFCGELIEEEWLQRSFEQRCSEMTEKLPCTW